MKKYLLCVALLVLSAVSFRTAGAKVCGAGPGGYTLNSTTGALTFDDDCTSLEQEAFFRDFFNDYQKIKSVDLSNTSVTFIGWKSFATCSNLASIKFPASLTGIDGDAFAFCSSLTSADFSGTSLTSIGYEAFSDCSSLNSVKFPDSLTKIDFNAFLSTSLASIVLPASLTDIGPYAFSGIANPATITVKYGSKAHELLGGLNSVTGAPINSNYGDNSTTLIVVDLPTPTPTLDPLDPTPLPSTPTPTPEPGTASGAADEIRVVPLPEDEFGSYELDPVTGEKNYLMFNTYAICMDFLNNEELCSGYERCYHK